MAGKGIKPQMDANERNALLIDESEIARTLNQFVRAVDTRDYALMRSCLTGQVDFDYSELGTSFPSDADQLVAAVRERHRGLHGVQHVTSNLIVEIDGDRAECHCNYLATHSFPNPLGGHLWTVAGRYRYRVVRLEGAWKIAACKIWVTWASGNRGIFDLARRAAQG